MTDLATDLDITPPPNLDTIIVDLIQLRAHHRTQAARHDLEAARLGRALRELHGLTDIDEALEHGDVDHDTATASGWQVVNEPHAPADPAMFALVDAEPATDGATEPAPELDLPVETQRTLDPPTEPAAVKQARPARESRHDWDAIALWIAAAKSNGTYSTAALAERFDVPTSTAKNWVGECRRRGLNVDPPAPTETSTELADHPSSTTKILLAEIADTYREALSVGRRPIQTLVDRYDVDRAIAQGWVNQCRKVGLLPPRTEPQVEATAPHRASPRHQSAVAL